MMLAAVYALVVGLAAGMMISSRRGGGLPRILLVALIGSHAGALIGALAGTGLSDLGGTPLLVEAGIALGSIAGAVTSILLDHRLATPKT